MPNHKKQNKIFNMTLYIPVNVIEKRKKKITISVSISAQKYK